MTTAPLTVNLHYFALLREQRGVEREEVRTRAATARDLYEELRRKYKFTLPPEKIGVAVNDKFCTADQSLQAGDTIVFIPPVAGG